MKQHGRLYNSVFNLMSGFGFRILSMTTAFLVRTVFVKCLDASYLGVSGLFSNILTMLSLAELGFGTAMIYSLYSPLATKDETKIRQLMALYRHVYTIIGTVILVIGMSLLPFLDKIIKDKPDIPYLRLYYVLYLLNSVFSYWFFSYKSSLLQADQRNYVITAISCIFNIIKTIAQIVLLIVFKNFTLYLITQITCTIGQNIAVSFKVNKDYGRLNDAASSKIGADEKNKIFKDVKALAIRKISFVALNGTDNIIISSIVGLTAVGILSNYLLITEALTAILCQFSSAVTASIGNYFAKHNSKLGYKLFLRVDFITFWMYGFSSVALITLLNPFITLWLGPNYLLEESTVICICINFFVSGFVNNMFIFRSTLGIFTKGQMRPVLVSILNIGLSIILGKAIGTTGVLAATFISRAVVNLWYDPLIILKEGFDESVKPFFWEYAFRLALLVFFCIILRLISITLLQSGISIPLFAVLSIITAIVPNALMVMAFRKRDEFIYFRDLVISKTKLIVGKILKL